MWQINLELIIWLYYYLVQLVLTFIAPSLVGLVVGKLNFRKGES